MKVKFDNGPAGKISYKHIYSPFFFVLFIVVCLPLFSCGGNGGNIPQEETRSASATMDGIGEESPGDSVDSIYLNSMIHCGRKVLLNFCYCCDCKFTKPILQSAIDEVGGIVTLVTVDVKEHFDLADEYGVKRSPFYILFDGNGERLDTLYGYRDGDLLDSKNVREWLEAFVVD